MKTTTYNINGILILSGTQKGIPGLRVEAWDKDFLVDDFVGDAITSEDGRFEISFSQQRFSELFLDRKPDIYFKIYHGETLVHSTETDVLWNIEGNQKDIEIIIDLKPEDMDKENTEGKIMFTGSVKHITGNPIEGISVKVFQKDLFKRKILAEAITDKNGNYSAFFQKPEDSNLAFVVEAQNIDGVSIATSDVYLKISERNTVDLTVIDIGFKGKTFFEQHAASLNKTLEEVKINAGNHKLTLGDLYLIANKNNLSVRESYLWLKSQENSDNTGVPAEFFYGLSKNGLPSDLIKLGFKKDEEIKQALHKAAENNHISESAAENAETLVLKWYGYLASNTLSIKANELDASLGDILSLTIEDANVQQNILLSYLNHDGTLEDFWSDLPTITGDKVTADQVNLSLRFAAFNGMQPFVTKGMLEDAKNHGENNFFHEMAGWDKQTMATYFDKWAKKYEQESIVPKFIGGDSEEDRKLKYAEALSEILKKQFPTHRLLGDLQRKQPNGFDNESNSLGVSSPSWENVFNSPMDHIIVFLKNNPEFEIAGINSDTFSTESPLNFEGVEMLNIKKDLESAKALFPYTTNIDNIITLLENGIHYSGDIVGMTQSTWVSKFGNMFSSKSESITAYGQAYSKYNLSLAAYGILHPGLNTNMSVIPTPADTIAEADWRTMFGSIDTCECKHCMSVYSPVAYYTDLLNFLYKRTNSSDETSSTIFNQLVKRRNDLVNIDLSCKNANVPMPYVDLVIEILEMYILTQEGETGLPSSFQTTGTAEELAANPQHIYKDLTGNYVNFDTFKEAYDPLKKSVYPHPLPFNFPLEEARIYLKHLGIPRHEIMQTFFEGNEIESFESFEINMERLQISPEESSILQGLKIGGAPNESETETRKFFGFKKDRVKEVIIDPADSSAMIPSSEVLWHEFLSSRVDVFLQQTGLVYKELLALLQCDFINPQTSAGERTITIQSPSDDPSTCRLDKLSLNGMTGEHLQKIHRIIRLWRKLNLKLWDIDRALTAIGSSKLNRIDLLKIAQADRLQNMLNLPPEVVYSFWSDISYTAYIDYSESNYPEIPTLYAKLFLNKTVINELDEAFSDPENFDETVLIVDETAGSDHTSTILSGLRLSAGDYELLTTELGLDGKLTLPNLSALHRYAVLSRKLGYKIEDFLSLKSLLGIDPFSDPTTTYDFLRNESFIKSSGFSLGEINYLLNHVQGEESGSAPTNDEISFFLTELRAALAALTASTDENLSETEKQTFLENERKKVVVQKVSEKLGISSTAIGLLMLNNEMLNHFSSDDFVDSIEMTTTPDDTATTDVDETVISLTTIAREEVVGDLTIVAFPDLFNDYVKLLKTAAFITKLNLSDTDLEYLLQYSNEIGCINFDELPFEEDSGRIDFSKFETLIQLIRARDLLPAGPHDFFEILDKEISGASSTEWTQLLIERLGYELELDGSLPKPFPTVLDLLGSSFTDGLKNGRSVIRLVQCLVTFNKLGLDVAAIKSLVDIENEIDTITSESIKNAVKAKYDEGTWHKISKPLRDQLREKQRGALVAYVLTHPETSSDLKKTWRNTDEMYEFFLIDVEMKPISMTSRIKQAICTVQLYIDRVLLGVEHLDFNPASETLSLAEEQENEWKAWRKLYRVWEANRKIFLYPENWLEPELRDNKSPFFKDLESQLLQNELTDGNVEDAFLAYLEKLDEVARLEIIGLYHQTENTGNDDETKEEDDTESVDIVHVFGRTYSNPHKYFYRQLENSEWSPWEAMEVDIDSNHIVPVIFNRRLCLFWLFWLEQSEETSSDTETPPRYWKIHVAWSEYKNGKWSGKKMSESFIESPRFSEWEMNSFEYYRQGTFVYSEIKSDKLLLNILGVYGYGDFELNRNSYHHVLFSLNDLSSEPELELFREEDRDYVLNHPCIAPENTSFHYMMYKEFLDRDEDDSPFYKDYSYQFDETGIYLGGIYNWVRTGYMVILNSTPNGFFYLVAPKNYLANPLESKFFFQDEVNTFYVNNSGGLSTNVVDTPAVISDPIVSIGEISENVQIVVEIAAPEVRFTFPELKQSSLFENMVGVEILTEVEIDIPINYFKNYQQNDTFTLINPSLKSPAKRSLGNNVSRKKSGDVHITHSDVYGYMGRKFSMKEKFTFQTFFHPQTKSFIRQINKFGIKGLLKRKLQEREDEILFEDTYNPGDNVKNPYPGIVEENETVVDFNYSGSYSIYNWELFFHAPMLIACRLSTDQRFEGARDWFHYIFDPTRSNAEETPETGGKKERFWQFYPFYKKAQEEPQTLGELIDTATAELEEQVEKWMDNPFQPHIIARLRITAYMKNVVMKYLDNLINWGDQLFRRDTIETLNEAANLYLLAGKILGARPQEIPPRTESLFYSFKELIDSSDGGLDSFSNAMVEIEKMITGASVSTGTTNSLGEMAYFCLIQNEKLLTYWDTIADRMFKIRNSMNIEGVVRTLPLYEPPIDPGMLVRAAAMGMDLSSILSDLSAPLPNYRFRFMIQKANELCNEVKSLGSSLLQALEKKDAEAMSLLRSAQEQKVIKAVLEMKEKQVEEAEENLASAEKAIELAQKKIDYYSSREFMNNSEKGYYESIKKGLKIAKTSMWENRITSVLALVPNLKIGGPTTAGTWYGGANLADASSAISAFYGKDASINSQEGSMKSVIGGYQRRRDDWNFQTDSSSIEKKQLEKQKLAAEIRLNIAEKDLLNQQLQIENAAETDEFMKSKFTNRQLYEWMTGQLATVYFQSYQVAYDVAKKAQKCYNYELGKFNDEEKTFIQFGYWDSLKKGLLSGEKLSFDLRRIEKSFFEENKRDFELTKNISLALFAPEAILELRANGECIFDIPEVLFDMDYAGHYKRRIKSISLSIPCIVGPYTTVACTLTMLSNKYRKETSFSPPYEETPDDMDYDSRFNYETASIQSIATSTGQRDSGLFQLNFEDERYIPFEGAGVISCWKIELPTEIKQFDYNSISDVIMHISYTAKDGGEPLKIAANENLLEIISGEVAENPLPLYKLFSLKHDFPGDYLKIQTGDVLSTYEIKINSSYFPFFAAKNSININEEIICYDDSDDFDGALVSTHLSCTGRIGDIADEWLLTFTVLPAPDTLTSDVYLLIKYTIKINNEN